MNNLLDDYLCKKYPKIFVERNLSMQETCMCWGFEHGNGWFFLIDSLCATIQGYIDNHNQWVKEYGKKFDEESQEHGKPSDPKNTTLIPQLVANQVKEKFGGLRFYHTGGDEVIDGMIRLAETLSYRICENCGAMNELVNPNSTGWIQTTCSSCARDKESHQKNRRMELVEIWNKVREDDQKEKESIMRK